MDKYKELFILINKDPSDTNGIDFSFLPSNINIKIIDLTIHNYYEIICHIKENLKKDQFVINLCDGLDEDIQQENKQPGKCVVELLETLQIPFTGSSSDKYAWKKSDIKKYNVSTPKYILIEKDIDWNNKNMNLSFPLIMKPNYNGGSVGITKESIINSKKELYKINSYLEKFNKIMIEEFIDGREFTVLACENLNPNEPIVFEPLECQFPDQEKFKHYDLKWFDYEKIKTSFLEEEKLKKKVMAFAKDIFLTLELDGYVRFDLRMDQNECLYVIDVNTYCALFYPPKEYGCADIILGHSKIMNHCSFIDHLIRCTTQNPKRLTAC
jgi:D-alanine-D-alanine ligase